ncbi:MAG: nucleoside-diphosphate kinase [Chloroflexi bacterium]|nr:nucleoside-diphosphate kinase [Chloroflexota bacterium]MQG00411.1 nucleoside-diphosphate kinase [SAR202 cluster bacterium]
MSTERTLVLVKPDGVQRGLVGTVVAVLERKGLKIVGMKMLHVSEELASRHYAAHTEKPFYKGLVSFITSSPLVALVLEGPRAVEVVRNTMGGTNPSDAAPGTIRGDFGLDIEHNIIHGSDSTESAQTEIGLFFAEDEVVDYSRSIDTWIIES